MDAERADLANRVGHAHIASNRAGAAITIDDVEVGVTPLREPPLVSVGVRKVKAALPGSAPLEQEVSVPAGETVEVHFDFPESPAAAPVPPPADAVVVPGLAMRRAPAPARLVRESRSRLDGVRRRRSPAPRSARSSAS